MKTLTTTPLVLVPLFLLVMGGGMGGCGSEPAHDIIRPADSGPDSGPDGTSSDGVAGPAGGQAYFFAFSKGMLENELVQQQRGYDAVSTLELAIKNQGTYASQALQERVRDIAMYKQNPLPFLVSGKIITNQLRQYAKQLKSSDTIIIYSHSHGVKAHQDQLGGLALDDHSLSTTTTKTYTSWAEYGQEVLDLPARTVVVLTMACFSGGLVEYLSSSPTARALWQDRAKQGRNFIVLTSQDASSKSNPRKIDGQIINPFTYALKKAFQGEADGYQRGRASKHPDKKLTVGELVEFVLDETRKHTSANDGANDPRPQVLGSYSPDVSLTF
jgi:hypothetical protein